MKKYISLTMVALLIIAMIVLAYFTWPVADDYSYTLSAQTRGVFGAALNVYHNWSGRFVTTLVGGFLLKTADIRYLNFISIASTVLLFLCIYLVVDMTSSLVNISKWILFLLFVPIFWFGLSYIYGQVVLWAIGGVVYMLPLLLALFIQSVILRIVVSAKTYSILEICVIWLISVVAGNTIEFVFVATLTMSFGVLIMFKRELSSASKKQILIISSGILIGALILAAAPGNFVRASYSSDALKFNFFQSVYNLFYLILKYTYVCKWFFVLALLSSFVCVKKCRSGVNFDRMRRYSVVFFSMVFSTLVPMILLKDFAATRTALFYGVYAFIGSFVLMLTVHKGTLAAKNGLKDSYDNFVLMLAFCALANVSFDIYLASSIRDQYAKRIESLNAQKGQFVDVDVPNINGPYPSSNYVDDIKSDPAHWVNVEVAKYYKFKSIRLMTVGN